MRSAEGLERQESRWREGLSTRFRHGATGVIGWRLDEMIYFRRKDYSQVITAVQYSRMTNGVYGATLFNLPIAKLAGALVMRTGSTQKGLL